MEYRHLRFFIAVAEELSFSRAAAKLHVSQPHLSREIRRLEDELEVPLFIRDRRRVLLSSGGQAFLGEAIRILDHTSEAVQTTQRAHRGQTGRVCIGFSSSAGFGMLPDTVRRFRQEWPDVDLVLTELNSDEQPALIRGGILDAGLLYPPLHAEQGLVQELLVMDPLVVALPEGHALADRPEIALERLATEPWIFFPRAVASHLHDKITNACREAGFAPRVVQRALKLSTIASLVATGLGVALVPAPLTSLRLKGTVARPLIAPIPLLPLSLMWRQEDVNPALKAFAEVIRAEAKHFRV